MEIHNRVIRDGDESITFSSRKRAVYQTTVQPGDAPVASPTGVSVLLTIGDTTETDPYESPAFAVNWEQANGRSVNRYTEKFAPANRALVTKARAFMDRAFAADPGILDRAEIAELEQDIYRYRGALNKAYADVDKYKGKIDGAKSRIAELKGEALD